MKKILFCNKFVLTCRCMWIPGPRIRHMALYWMWMVQQSIEMLSKWLNCEKIISKSICIDWFSFQTDISEKKDKTAPIPCGNRYGSRDKSVLPVWLISSFKDRNRMLTGHSFSTSSESSSWQFRTHSIWDSVVTVYTSLLNHLNILN